MSAYMWQRHCSESYPKKIKNQLWFALELADTISFVIIVAPRVFCESLNERALGLIDSLEPVMKLVL